MKTSPMYDGDMLVVDDAEVVVVVGGGEEDVIAVVVEEVRVAEEEVELGVAMVVVLKEDEEVAAELVEFEVDVVAEDAVDDTEPEVPDDVADPAGRTEVSRFSAYTGSQNASRLGAWPSAGCQLVKSLLSYATYEGRFTIPLITALRASVSSACLSSTRLLVALVSVVAVLY